MHRSAKALKSFDQDGVNILIEASKDASIKVILNRHPTEITHAGNSFILHSSDDHAYETDCIIGATGRIPNVEVFIVPSW